LSAAPRQAHRRAAFPRLDHDLLVGPQLDGLAGRQHVVVEIAAAGDPGAARLDRESPRAPRAQQPHAAGLQQPIAEQRGEH